ncbi:MAG: aspartate aminotransferase family protein [Thermoproteota archaeon]|nr:MAG: aspartate aminotransferase family protein [Candidatus Korarchaeota archaeon]
MKPSVSPGFPGPKAREIVERSEKVLAKSTRLYPLVGVGGEGCYIKDIDGNTFLDFSSAIAVMNLGYAHPEIAETIREYSSSLVHFAGQDYYNPEQLQLAEKLAELSPAGMKPVKVFLSNSGTESVEAAYKAVVRSTGKPVAISFIGAFHGRTLGSLSLTCSKIVHRKGYHPLRPVIHTPYAYCYRCRFKLTYPDCDIWCAKYIEEVLLSTVVSPDDVAFMALEPVQGEGGYVVGPPEFYQEIKKICDRNKIALIDDEVQAGMFRTGEFLGIMNFNITPDVYTLAKALASGIPMGATVLREEYSFKDEGAHSNTFGGNILACAVALKTIEVILRDKLHDNARRIGEYILKRAREWVEQYPLIGDARGLGLMIGVEVVSDKARKTPGVEERKKLLWECLKRGLILLPCGLSSFRIAPPLNITEEEAEAGCNIIEESIKQLLS